jgi:hypothetical protein
MGAVMKKVIIIGAVVVIAVFAVQYFKKTDKETFLNYSRTRVDKMLYGIQSQKTALEQESIGYWYKGSPKIAVNESLSNSFNAFKKQKGIYRFSNYEVLSAELFNGDDVVNRYVEVRFEVDGKELGLIVRHGKTMEWID